MCFVNKTTPNTNTFMNLTSRDSYLKCTPTNHESLVLTLETPHFGTLKIHNLFIWCPKMHS